MKDSPLAPISLFVFSRPDHTRRTVEALAANTLARHSDLFVFADHWKRESQRDAVGQVQDYIATLGSRGWFRHVYVTCAKENLGLAASIISGVTQVISQSVRCVVLEDDLVTGPGFLQYLNDALDFFAGDRRIWSISGYSSRLRFPPDYDKDLYLSYRSSSHGWATWRDRWEMVDWDVKDYASFRHNLLKRLRFNRGGGDLSRMLDRQMAGRRDSWAIRWCYAQHLHDAYAVYPVRSLVRNLGFDGSGTHCEGSINRFSPDLAASLPAYRMETLSTDPRILRAFRAQFALTFKDYLYALLRGTGKLGRLIQP